MERIMNAARRMAEEIAAHLESCAPHIYLYGSVPMGDYREGWSDIDLLVLTDEPISPAIADGLLMLRQQLVQKSGDPVFRRFEGGILSLEAFLRDEASLVVYWGTGGQRLCDRYTFDSFSRWELLHSGVLLHGTDVRDRIALPDAASLRCDVARHLSTVRQHGRGGSSLYTFGWLLDIARGLYTLRTGCVAAKTAAGQWALDERLCPDPSALELALRVRRDPALQQQEAVLSAAMGLTDAIQRFADVLDRELNG